MAVDRANATRIVRDAVSDTGLNVLASCDVARYDARAPLEFRSASWLPGARGMVVAGSAGPALWRAFRSATTANPDLWASAHPYDEFVSRQLDRADAALTNAGVRFRRFDAAFQAPVRIDFVALAQVVGLGEPGPFGLAIHPEHGAWWALRGAWLVDAEVERALERRARCVGCAAPCVGAVEHAKVAGFALATAEVRSRCVVGQGSRYDDDQIAYHYERSARRPFQKRGS